MPPLLSWEKEQFFDTKDLRRVIDAREGLEAHREGIISDVAETIKLLKPDSGGQAAWQENVGPYADYLVRRLNQPPDKAPSILSVAVSFNQKDPDRKIKYLTKENRLLLLEITREALKGVYGEEKARQIELEGYNYQGKFDSSRLHTNIFAIGAAVIDALEKSGILQPIPSRESLVEEEAEVQSLQYPNGFQVAVFGKCFSVTEGRASDFEMLRWSSGEAWQIFSRERQNLIPEKLVQVDFAKVNSARTAVLYFPTAALQDYHGIATFFEAHSLSESQPFIDAKREGAKMHRPYFQIRMTLFANNWLNAVYRCGGSIFTTIYTDKPYPTWKYPRKLRKGELGQYYQYAVGPDVDDPTVPGDIHILGTKGQRVETDPRQTWLPGLLGKEKQALTVARLFLQIAKGENVDLIITKELEGKFRRLILADFLNYLLAADDKKFPVGASFATEPIFKRETDLIMRRTHEIHPLFQKNRVVVDPDNFGDPTQEEIQLAEFLRKNFLNKPFPEAHRSWFIDQSRLYFS